METRGISRHSVEVDEIPREKKMNNESWRFHPPIQNRPVYVEGHSLSPPLTVNELGRVWGRGRGEPAQESMFMNSTLLPQFNPGIELKKRKDPTLGHSFPIPSPTVIPSNPATKRSASMVWIWWYMGE